MPISPDRMKLYPGGSTRSPEWKAIRAFILFRAGNRCEGTPQFPFCRMHNGETNPLTGSRVVLTIMHMNHDESDCSENNLRAGCQKCHNSWDAKHRAVNAAITRARKVGQDDLYAGQEPVQPVAKPDPSSWPRGAMCGSCAGRKGTEANCSPETMATLRECIESGEPFYCHDSVAVLDPIGGTTDRHGNRYRTLPFERWRLCRAWMNAQQREG
ncbi:MAG: hypothetical protein GC182_08790 [Rhodopseudomonas sp.]|nr:hypothetical protein [Rhodopseudomonas sp.]